MSCLNCQECILLSSMQLDNAALSYLCSSGNQYRVDSCRKLVKDILELADKAQTNETGESERAVMRCDAVC